MNRAQKKTILLLAVILVLLAVILAASKALREEADQAAAEEADQQAESITQPESDYTALTYNNGSATLSFHLDETGNWVWSDDTEFPLDDSTITSILYQISNLTPQQTITEGDTLEAYGLDQPSATLTATEADGSTVSVALGGTTTDGNSYYMLLNGQESPVYIISDRLYTYMSKTIYDMCDLPELPELTEENLQSVTVSGAVSTVLRPDRQETGTDEETGEPTYTVTWSSGGEDVTDLDMMTSLLSDLTTFSLEKCVDFKPTDEAVTLCGFDAPQAVLTAAYVTDTGIEGSLLLTVGSENLDQSGYYVRVNDDPTIYQMASADVNAILSVAAGGLTADEAAAE